MKKGFLWGLLIIMLFNLVLINSALAENTSVMPLGELESPVDFSSDVRINVGDTVEVKGVGEVRLLSVDWPYAIGKWSPEIWGTTTTWYNVEYYSPGGDASFLQVVIEVKNTQNTPCNLYDQIRNIVCTYRNKKQFAGWMRGYKTVTAWNRKLEVLSESEGGTEIAPGNTVRFSLIVTIPSEEAQEIKIKNRKYAVSFDVGGTKLYWVNKD